MWSRPCSERRASTTDADRQNLELEGRAPRGRWAAARQLQDGSVLVRASCEESVAQARFLLALDDDTSEFHRRFARDPLLGPSVRNLRGLRTTRTPTVAHAALRAVCGQLIQSRRAREIERTVIRACGESPPTREALASLFPPSSPAAGSPGVVR